MCEGSFLPSSFGPHQKHTEFESSLRSYPIHPSPQCNRQARSSQTPSGLDRTQADRETTLHAPQSGSTWIGGVHGRSDRIEIMVDVLGRIDGWWKRSSTEMRFNVR